MEKDKDIIEIIADEPYEDEEISQKPVSDGIFRAFKSKISVYLSSLPADLSPRFVIIMSAVCAALIIAAPFIGFNVPKSDRTAEKSLAALQRKDKTYVAARDTKDDEAHEAEVLTKSLEDKKDELEEFHKSQDNLDKMTESNKSLEDERTSLQEEIKQKQKTLDDIENSISARANKTMTWTSGDYTVGKDIAAGKYTVTGTGSIAIANSGRSIANKMLKSEGENFTLNSGDRIHIDGSARITPQ